MKIVATEYAFEQHTWTGGTAVSHGDAEPRSPLLHVGQVIRDIENRVVKPGERKPTEELSPAEKQRMGNYVEMGFIFELMVEHFFRARMLNRRAAQAGVVSQTEIIYQGMAMTPDGWCPADDTVEEYKATWRSLRRATPPESIFDSQNFWSWGAQSKSYCLAHDTRLARFFVFWVNGNYKESGPVVYRYDVEWSAQEIAENWRMIQTHAARMEGRRW